MFTPDEIARVKARVSIEQYLVNPRRQGGYLVARCPFPEHEERTPSFRYNIAEGWFKCMGCGRKGGDVIAFLQQYWDCGFTTVMDRLGAAPDAGAAYAPVGLRSPRVPQDRQPALPDAEARAIFRVAAETWATSLWRPGNRDALDYVRDRGLPDALIRSECLGFSADTLTSALRERGLSRERAVSMGLLRTDGHETLAGRITFTEWRQLAGVWEPVWATGRLCSQGPLWDTARKYLNVRGDRLVFGYHRALGHRDVGVVEGPFDRLALIAFGDQAVAIGSAEPSPGMYSELRTLARSARLYLWCDRDRVGRKGRIKTLYTLALPPASSVYFADLPRVIKDPGALTARPDGAALYVTARAGARRIDIARFMRLCRICERIVQRRTQERRMTRSAPEVALA